MERVRPQPAAQVSGRRKSVFTEVGLIDEDTISRVRNPAPILVSNPSPNRLRPTRLVRFRSTNEVFEHRVEGEEADDSDWETDSESEDHAVPMRLYAPRNMSTYTRAYKLGVLGLLLALMLPIIQINPIARVGVTGGVIPTQSIEPSVLVARDDTDTNICKRWSHQATIVNGTLYVYGGRTSTESTQKNDTWTNNFLTLDLTKSWQISSPSLTGLPIPSGPPAVANGYLYNSLDSLWLYGGEFSDSPVALPSSNSIWEYNIINKQWYEHENPQTSSGDNAQDDGQPIQRSAEGAGFGVPTLGRGWYFGGHIDYLTTEGWSYYTPRIYLKSLVEFTFPGFTNNGVNSLKDGKTAPTDGTWRNITEGGMQDTSGFTERADGLLLYVPGFGDEGLLLGLTGGVNESFTQMNVIDVYDIAKSNWYKQSTSGTMPKYRVNPCAVVAAAADGSSYNVYMFGGQNLQPTGDQIQYDDMWILSIPSFTWIEVDQSKQSVPYARAGHSCNVWDGQMIVVGGYVGQELSCDSPGIYVFNMSSLSWSDQFTALTGDRALQAFTGKQDDAGNPLAQQANQRGFDAKAGLEGSYGYAVPAAVQSVIGGKETGGATLTAPVQTPTEGPLATGKPQTYTVTGPNGAIVTETASAAASNSGGKGTNVGAIIAGVIAGVFFLIAGYFAFCAWIYRKQVKLWKQHATMVAAQSRSQNGEKMSSSNNNDPFLPQGGMLASSGRGSSDRNYLSQTNTSTGGRQSNEERLGTGNGSVEMGRRSSEGSVSDELLSGQEPSFWGARGVLLNPRRSLKVVNKD